jgi:hypothetical protein
MSDIDELRDLLRETAVSPPDNLVDASPFAVEPVTETTGQSEVKGNAVTQWSTFDSGCGLVFDILTARETCALPDPPESDKLLGDFVIRGNRIIVGGHTGEGKTTMALQIIRAIVAGETFLEWDGPGDLRALVVDAEQGLRTVKRRLREAGLDQSEAVDYLRIPDGLSLDRDTEQALALARVLEAGDYAAVVLDPLYKLHAGDSNVERAAVDLMRLFDAWRERYRFALVLPVHLRKPIPGERFSIHDIFGASAYVRGAEVVVGIRRVSHGYAELHFFKDRDGELEVGAKWGLLFDREQGYRRDPKDEEPPRDLAADIAAWLDEHPRSTTNAVVVGVGAGKGRVSDTLKNDERFTFEKGPNNARLWVVRNAENHPDHPEPPEAVSGGQLGGLSLESHHQTTHGGGRSVVSDHLDEEELARLESLAEEMGL